MFLLRHGKALDLRHPAVIDDTLAQRSAGTRYWDHMRVCRVPSMRTATAGLSAVLDHIEDVVLRGKAADADVGKRLSAR